MPPPLEVKANIRQAVFQGLSDPNSKIRSLCAQTLSLIASSDWPEEYPDLLNSLIVLLSSNSPASVHGAMQVFTEFVGKELTEDQILPVLRQLLPVLLSILGASEQHTALTRARTISVFRQCVETLFMVKEQFPQSVKEATGSILPVWIEAFKMLLKIDPRTDVENTANWDGLAIRIQIYKTLDIIYVSFARALIPHLQELLTVSLNHLNALFPAFTQYYLSGEHVKPTSSEDQPIEIPHLMCPLLDFVSNVTRGGKAKEWFEPANLNALIGAIFGWAQMTQDDEDEWATDANAFVAQESDETNTYSVRIAGFDLLASIFSRSAATTASSCQAVVQQLAVQSEEARSAGRHDWWRPLEAALAAVGSQSDALLDCLEDEELAGRPKPIDIQALLTNVVPSLVSISECPFLQGRAFVFASQFARLLPAHMAGQYVEAAVQVLETESAGIPIKLSAVKAILNFCQKDVDDAVIAPMAPRIAKDLGPFLSATTEDTLSLVLETLSVIVELDDGKWLDRELAGNLVLAVLGVWMKNNKDPIFISILSDILENLAKSPAPGVYESVVKHALPGLCNAIMASSADEPWITGAAIDLVGSLVQGAPESGLGEGFFAHLGPSLFLCMRTVEDRDVIQSGISCLTSVIRKDFNQLVSWSDPSTGQSGLESVLTVIARRLQSDDESGGLAIGDLIIHLLRRAGEAVGPVLPELLQAMVRRMTTAKTATFLQSLVIPFAFLIHSQRDTVLTLLESTNIDGRSGLDILIQTWCENAETFQGFWATRISTLGLCSLYASERPSLQHLMVKGDLIIKPETKDVIMTRSKTKKIPTEFTSIAFPVKALKLLLHDLQSGGEAATMNLGAVPEIDSDDEDDEWTEEEKLHQGFKADEFAFLSEMLGPRGTNFDIDDTLSDGDDEDLRNDPISQMDMRAHLLSFFRECASRNTSNFSVAVDQLTAEETLVVHKAVSEQ
ncbi:ARM repeat-containing protein [Sparassis crispa]|uniref:ARM repeat-containing protein n=1 Tax=Sparassis crispa TaxID=139825 RepID=A0A401G579_9APHY|nr:ARM repeat-containing protein [Sparassis crispa]GBE77314.1 ARM repeat-containing protein [Sparassis crispa]